MRARKNIVILFCLLAAPKALGMRITCYTDAHMIDALENNNRTRINALLKHAAQHMHLYKKSPIGPKIINVAINQRGYNLLEIIKLLLDNNAPIDSNAVPDALDLNIRGIKIEKIKSIINLLLEHKAPLDERALEKALVWGLDDYIEPFLQYKAPISNAAIECACKDHKDTILTLFVRYNPDIYKTVEHELMYGKHYDIFHALGTLREKIIWYLDNKNLKYASHNYYSTSMDNFVPWFNENNADLKEIPSPDYDDVGYSYAYTLLRMPNITLPYDFKELLQKLEPKDSHLLMLSVTETERDVNQKYFKCLLDFLIDNNDEATIKDYYFWHTNNDDFMNKPIICGKILYELRKRRMNSKYMNPNVYNNITFTFK